MSGTILERRVEMVTPDEDGTPVNKSPSHIKDGKTHNISLKTDDLLINQLATVSLDVKPTPDGRDSTLHPQ